MGETLTPRGDARWRGHVAPCALCLFVAAAVACGSSERSPLAGSAGTFSGGAGGTRPVGPGGEGGAAGDSSDASTPPIAGSGPTPLDAGDADGGEAGDAGELSDADAASNVPPSDASTSDGGTGEEVPAVWTCDGDRAFGAGDTLAFSDPTPTALASALTEISGPAHPISLVLHLEDGALFGALSATTGSGGGQETFASDEVSLDPVVPAFGSPPGVTTVDAQQIAVLQFEDEVGPVELEVEHIVWRATQGTSSCDTLTVSLQAVIPTSQLSVVLHLSTGDATIGELSSPPSGPIVGPPPPPTPIEIAATFQGVPLDFDFGSL